MSLDELELFAKVEAATAQQGGDSRFVEAGGVVLYADGALVLVETDATDAVDLAEIVKGAHLGLAGDLSVTEHDIDGGHFGPRLSNRRPEILNLRRRSVALS